MNIDELKKVRRDLHRIPEIGFQEYKTQKYLLEFLSKLPQTHLQIETWKTGIFVRVEGTKGEKTIGYRADIDGLPIKEDTDLPFLSQHIGQMHACGHDFHMTIALALVQKLVFDRPDNHVLIIFQPAEEGPGGALPMLQSDTMKKWWPDVIFAMHIAPELPVGTVSSKEGLLFANTSELFVDWKGKGGHAAYPHQTKDMIVAASSFVVELQQIVSRMIDPLDSAVISIGKITGGFVQNVIAENARLEGTIRTLSADTMDSIKDKIEKLVQAMEIRFDCVGSIDYGSNYYQVWNNGEYINQFEQQMNQANIVYKQADQAMTGEDFGYMVKEIPGFMFWLGVDSPYGLHHAKINPNEDALIVGLKAAERMIRYINV
ncbi:N-acetyldiaminopimelate deacetylase [Salirhabdus euzebyi]|uniref:N-acetyldiaminopimelate deacetylase n=1 Tax=Salirhabdus euzebyi TaxID=394506 RepID=A0A841QAG7_9BACI|nr:N-acetyldiaminopimelate deacetylase [Salirhabdus euzebyi]MBB6455410.1 N-acetyldiaminopimelate deacetylase [Salirhabdus euzebyi]